MLHEGSREETNVEEEENKESASLGTKGLELQYQACSNASSHEERLSHSTPLSCDMLVSAACIV